MKGKDVRIIAILLTLVIAWPSLAQETRQFGQITVTGQGAVESVPDMATITMGVVSQGKTGAQAMARNSKDLAAMMAKLKAAGIAPRDMQTSNLSLSPRWDNRPSSKGGDPEIIGFVAQNTVTVRIRDMARLGEILDAVVQNGANSFRGLSFGLQHPRPAQDQARIKAVEDAITKAKLLTNAAGVELGDIISISESTSGRPSPMMMNDMAMARGAVPVEAGDVSTGASVTIVFKIK